MNKKKQMKQIVLAVVALLLVAGCDNKPSVEDPIGGVASFEYKIETRKELRIDYGFEQDDYIVLFELYEESPLAVDADGQSYKKDIEPFYRAATDGRGRFQGDVQVLSSLRWVWLYSEYAGTISPVKVPVEGNAIVFDQKAYLREALKPTKGTRALSNSGKKYPDGWMVLGDWDQYGTPDYLDSERRLPATSLLYTINDIFVKYNGKRLQDRYPEFFDAARNTDVRLTKRTKVYLTFVNSTAAWNNVVGYFHYPTAGPVPQTPAEVKRILAYPAATPFVKTVAGETMRGALVAGSRVLLRYWDGKEFHDEFPAGVTIGWWLEGMGFNPDASITEKSFGSSLARYSLEHLNADRQRRAVSLLDSKSGRIVSVAFEDNMDMRYNDATFYLETDVEGAIEPTLPAVPDGGGAPEDKDNYYKKKGVLLFEDLWPSTGDYDMNDVMVRYSSTVYKHILSNRVYKIVDEYTPLHSGGSLISGFGFQYSDLRNNELHYVQVEGETTSKFMEGAQLEPGQDKPTVMLFDNVRQVLGKKFVVTAEFNDAMENALVPPYNPFIVVGTDKGRSKEVHLVQYPPTSKADPLLFGTKNDGSDLEKGIFYINTDGSKFPFALNIPMVETMPIFEEKVRIDVSYPKYRSWVESNGTQDADWFRYPAK